MENSTVLIMAQHGEQLNGKFYCPYYGPYIRLSNYQIHLQVLETEICNNV